MILTYKIKHQEDFKEEFPLFLKGDENWGNLPVKKQMGAAFANFIKSKPLFDSFEEFLIAAGIPPEKFK